MVLIRQERMYALKFGPNDVAKTGPLKIRMIVSVSDPGACPLTSTIVDLKLLPAYVISNTWFEYENGKKRNDSENNKSYAKS